MRACAPRPTREAMPPGRSMGPWPRHATTRSSRASTWALDNARIPAARAASRSASRASSECVARAQGGHRQGRVSHLGGVFLPRRHRGRERARPLGERVVVGRAQGGRAGQSGNRVHPQSRGQGGDRGVAQCRAAQGAAVRGAPRPVDVVGRVLKRGETRLGARLLRVRSPQPEEGAQPRHPIIVARDGGDGPQGRGARAAREAQEDRLSLVVHRVAEEDRGTLTLGDRSQGGSAGVTG